MRKSLRALAVTGFDGFDTGTDPPGSRHMTIMTRRFPFPGVRAMVLSEIVAKCVRLG